MFNKIGLAVLGWYDSNIIYHLQSCCRRENGGKLFFSNFVKTQCITLRIRAPQAFAILISRNFFLFARKRIMLRTFIFMNAVYKGKKSIACIGCPRLGTLKHGKSLQTVFDTAVGCGAVASSCGGSPHFKFCVRRELLVFDESLNQLLHVFGKKRFDLVLTGFASAIDPIRRLFCSCRQCGSARAGGLCLFIESLRALHELGVEAESWMMPPI